MARDDAPGGGLGPGRKWCKSCGVRKGPNDGSPCATCIRRMNKKRKGR